MLDVFKSIQTHWGWFLGLCLWYGVFFFSSAFWYSPLLTRFGHAALDLGGIVQAYGGASLWTLPEFRSGLLVVLGLLCLFVIAIYIMYSFFISVAWWLGQRVVGDKNELFAHIWKINIFWILVLVIVRLLYFIIRFGLIVVDRSVYVLDAFAAFLVILIFFLAFISYAQLKQKRPLKRTWNFARSKKGITFIVVGFLGLGVVYAIDTLILLMGSSGLLFTIPFTLLSFAYLQVLGMRYVK